MYTIDSVIKIVPATDTAFSSAKRVTLVGSIIPSLTKLLMVLVFKLYPCSEVTSDNRFTIPNYSKFSYPALDNIFKNGAVQAR